MLHCETCFPCTVNPNGQQQNIKNTISSEILSGLMEGEVTPSKIWWNNNSFQNLPKFKFFDVGALFKRKAC